MMNEQDIVPGDQTPAQPSPQLQSVPGYQTTSGQFTAIFTLVALLLGLLGFHYSPAQIEGWVDLVEKLLATLGPIIAAVPVLITYINSRGKIASNTLNANAVVMSQPTPVIAPVSFADPDGLTGILGGDDWKDPDRYENLLKMASMVGVPGASQADKINQQLHPGALIKGIFSMLKEKKQQK